MEKEKKIQERTVINRQKIIVAAKELFNTKGYFNTNTKEIAKLAGVSTGSFYNYFPDKLEVFQEIMTIHINKNYSDLAELIKKLDERPELARDSLSDYIRTGMAAAYKSMVLFQNYESIAMTKPELRDRVNDVSNKIMTALYTFCKESPHVKKRISPLVMSQMSYFLVQGISEYLAKLPEDVDKSDYEEQLVEIAHWYLFGN
ncbi:TetR/AcrR family transcriptional regulator [Acetobacterium bakii]|uniref:TetR/AcrR family transcriptional regulator n=1 Tax=Acetobacterium bakii TaxID=52689 RepID=UPI000680E3C5|nr:TetR/AcrR family transcriptional regulator [Acetobacterium bakii]